MGFLNPFLYFSLISAVASSTPRVTSAVGNYTVLPCFWASRPELAQPSLHVQWETLETTVFERKGAERWEGSRYEGRVEVSPAELEEGDCSLLVRDVQLSDAGTYESFMVVDRARLKRRIFIKSVYLTVIDNKSQVSVTEGEEVELKLYGPQGVRVVFQGREGTEWKERWMKGAVEGVRRGCLEETEGTVVLRRVIMEDAGIYKVLDNQGLALSTVLVTVKAKAEEQTLYDKLLSVTGNSTANHPSLLIVSTVLMIVGFVEYL